MSALAAYNVSLSSNSPFFVYSPNRDGDPTLTWNSSYTDSPIWPPVANQQEPAGIPYRRTQSMAASMAFDFVGSAVYLCFSGDASYAATLDNVRMASTSSGSDPACSGYRAATMIYSSGVKQGHHVVELTVDSASSDKELRFFGGIVTLGVTSGSSQVRERLVDDQDPGWHFVPGSGLPSMWQSGSDTPDHNMIGNTHSWTCTYDQVNQRSATYSFSGVGGVILRGPIAMGFQAYSVDFDDKTVPLDATSVWPDPKSNALFMRGGLDPKKQYTLTLRNYNANYPTADRNYYMPPNQPLLAFCANLDGLVLLGDGAGSAPFFAPNTDSPPATAPQSPPIPPTTSSTSSTASGSVEQDSSAGTGSVSKSDSRNPSVPVSSGGDQGQSTSPPAVPLHKKLSTGAIVGICFGIVVSVIATVYGAFAIFLVRANRKRERAANIYPLQRSDDPFADIHAIPSPLAGSGLVPSQKTGKLRALANAAGFSKSLFPLTPFVPMGTESVEPSEVMSAPESTLATTPMRRARMAPEDLEEVLAFVAQRMDWDHVYEPGNGGTLPPEYRD